MIENKLAVSEIFYSIQGEGRTVGIPSYFIRTAACNLMCGGYGTEKDKQLHDGATWRCDSIEVWQKGRKMTFEEIECKMIDLNRECNNYLKTRSAHIVITGGEPLIQDTQINRFIIYLHKILKVVPVVEIETNGTIVPNEFLMNYVDYFNVSPKLRNSGMPKEKRINEEALLSFNNLDSAIYKFVVSSFGDWAEILSDFIKPFDIPLSKVYLMPAADNQESLTEVSKMVVDICKDFGIKYSPREHIAIYNQKTGV